MIDLRDIVRRHVEEQALKEYFKDKYEGIIQEEKNSMLDFLRSKGHIDRGINNILNVFLEEIEKGSNKKKQRKILSILFVVINLIVTPTISYSVNNEYWPIVIGVSALFLLFSIIYIIVID